MARQLQFQWPKRRGPSDPWFRVGEIDVGTTTLIVALGVVSFFVYAISSSLLGHLFLDPQLVKSGQVWRIASWPLYNVPSIWTAFSLFILWWAGNQMEVEFGRIRWTKYLATMVLVPSIVITVLALSLGKNQAFAAAGINLVELGVICAYVAERPTIRFMFGIPGWILLAVFIGIDVLRYAGDRLWLVLLFELMVVGTALLLLRSFGYGDAVPWVPKINLPSIITGLPKARGARPSRPAKAKKPAKGAAKGSGGVVTGPWQGSGTSTGAGSPVNQKDVDRVLDKIAAHGMDSLTPDERHLLEEASRRKRDGRA